MTSEGYATDHISRRAILGFAAGITVGASLPSEGGAVPSRRLHAADYQWNMYRGGPAQSGTAQTDGLSSYDRELFSVGGSDSGTMPAVARDKLYAGTDTDLVAANLHSGAGDWVYQGTEHFALSPALTESRVIGVTFGASVVAVDRSTGEQAWSFGLNDISGAPTVHDGTVYLADGAGRVYAFESAEGELCWSTELGANKVDYNGVQTRPSVAIGTDAIYVNVPDHQAAPSRLVSLSFDGEINWVYEIDADSLLPPTVTENGVVAQTRQSIRVLSKNGSIERWSKELRGMSDHPPAAGNGYVAVVSDPTFSDTGCSVYDITSGETQWTYTIEDGTTDSGVVITDTIVYFSVATGGSSGKFVAVGLQDGLERFSVDTAYPGDTPVPVPDGVFVPHGDSCRLLVSENFHSSSNENESESSTNNSGPASSDGSDPDSSIERSTPASSERGQQAETGGDAGGTGGNGGAGGSSGFPLSTIESVVVITSSLCGGIYTLSKLLRGGKDG